MGVQSLHQAQLIEERRGQDRARIANRNIMVGQTLDKTRKRTIDLQVGRSDQLWKSRLGRGLDYPCAMVYALRDWR